MFIWFINGFYSFSIYLFLLSAWLSLSVSLHISLSSSPRETCFEYLSARTWYVIYFFLIFRNLYKMLRVGNRAFKTFCQSYFTESTPPLHVIKNQLQEYDGGSVDLIKARFFDELHDFLLDPFTTDTFHRIYSLFVDI